MSDWLFAPLLRLPTLTLKESFERFYCCCWCCISAATWICAIVLFERCWMC